MHEFISFLCLNWSLGKVNIELNVVFLIISLLSNFLFVFYHALPQYENVHVFTGEVCVCLILINSFYITLGDIPNCKKTAFGRWRRFLTLALKLYFNAGLVAFLINLTPAFNANFDIDLSWHWKLMLTSNAEMERLLTWVEHMCLRHRWFKWVQNNV